MTRKLFGTDGVRGTANTYPMTPEVAMRLGKAFAEVIGRHENRNHERHKVVIGKDTRISGYMIETALTSGIVSMGVDVFLVGPMPTPAVAHLTKSFAADAGIVISASHNPAEHNGIKFFDRNGLKLPDEVEERIEKLFFSEEIKAEHVKGRLIGKAYRIDDAKGRYIEFAKSSIQNSSLEGIKIVLDVANGAAYSISPDILRELGAEVIVLNSRPNGLNINLDCGALHPELIRKEVAKNKADIGIAFDGDADRVIMVDEKGNDVDGDHIMAISAIRMLGKKKLNKNTLVATQYSNLGLDRAMEKADGKVVRVENGDRYVVEEMLKNGYNFGGEQSGHIIFFDYTTTGDGTIAALQILNIMKETGKKLSELAKCMQRFPQVLVNVPVKEKKDLNRMPGVLKAIKDAEKKLGKEGRIFVRYSGTENICRIMVEGKSGRLIKQLADNVAKEVRKGAGK